MGQDEYTVVEFAQRLAKIEAKYGEEILEIIECFTKSRVDLPVKKLKELNKARIKCSRHLQKMDWKELKLIQKVEKIDSKNVEMIGLWNLCNIYSTAAVDIDAAMRKIRQTIRKRLDMKDSPKNSISSFPLIDDYRPPTKKNEHQQEIYDKPTNKEKQSWREMFFLRRKDKDSYNNNNNDYATITRKSKAPPPPPSQKLKNNTLSIVVPPTAVDPPANNNIHQPKLQRPQRIRSPPRPPPPKTAPPSISTLQHSMKAEAPHIPPRKEGEQSSVTIQNCPPIPSRPPTITADLATRTNINAEEPNCKSTSPPEELAPPPRQISPGNLYKPTAPPRPSAPRTKIITVDTSEDVSNNTLESGAVFQLSHTTAIAILPSPEAKKESTSIERHGSGGVLAKRHSIKINTNAIVDPESVRRDTTMVSNGSSGEHSVIINRL